MCQGVGKFEGLNKKLDVVEKEAFEFMQKQSAKKQVESKDESKKKTSKNTRSKKEEKSKNKK